MPATLHGAQEQVLILLQHGRYGCWFKGKVTSELPLYLLLRFPFGFWAFSLSQSLVSLEICVFLK